MVKQMVKDETGKETYNERNCRRKQAESKETETRIKNDKK